MLWQKHTLSHTKLHRTAATLRLHHETSHSTRVHAVYWSYETTAHITDWDLSLMHDSLHKLLQSRFTRQQLHMHAHTYLSYHRPQTHPLIPCLSFYGLWRLDCINTLKMWRVCPVCASVLALTVCTVCHAGIRLSCIFVFLVCVHVCA